MLVAAALTILTRGFSTHTSSHPGLFVAINFRGDLCDLRVPQALGCLSAPIAAVHFWWEPECLTLGKIQATTPIT